MIEEHSADVEGLDRHGPETPTDTQPPLDGSGSSRQLDLRPEENGWLTADKDDADRHDWGPPGPSSDAPDPSPATSSAPEPDERLCRVCREGPFAWAPLCAPCKCRGSIGWVHEPCIVAWVLRTGIPRCELCGTLLTFHRVYPHGTPAVPGLSHIVRYALLQARRELTEKARYALFFGAYLGFYPYSTAWMARLGVGLALRKFPGISAFWAERTGSLVEVAIDLAIGFGLMGILFALLSAFTMWRAWFLANAGDLPEYRDIFDAAEGARLRYLQHRIERARALIVNPAPVVAPHPPPAPVAGNPAQPAAPVVTPSAREVTPSHGAPAAPREPPLENPAAAAAPVSAQDAVDTTPVSVVEKPLPPNEFPRVLALLEERARAARQVWPPAATPEAAPRVGEAERADGLEIVRRDRFLETLFTLWTLMVLFLAICVTTPVVVGRLYWLGYLTFKYKSHAAPEVTQQEFEILPTMAFGYFVLSIWVYCAGHLLDGLNRLTQRLFGHRLTPLQWVLLLEGRSMLVHLGGFLKVIFGVVIDLVGMYVTGTLLLGAVTAFVDLPGTPIPDADPLEVVAAIFYPHSYLTVLGRWLAGLVCLSTLSYSISVLFDLLRPGVLWFFRTPTDDTTQIVRDMLRVRILVRLMFWCRAHLALFVLQAALVRVPLRMARCLVPHAFPLAVVSNDPAALVSWAGLVVYFALTATAHPPPSPQDVLARVYGPFLWRVGGTLGLTGYLFGVIEVPEGAPTDAPLEGDTNVPPVGPVILQPLGPEHRATVAWWQEKGLPPPGDGDPTAPAPAAMPAANNAPAPEDDDGGAADFYPRGEVEGPRPRLFFLRLAALLALAWGAAATATAAAVTVPLLAGRAFLAAAWWGLGFSTVPPLDPGMYVVGLFALMGIISVTVVAWQLGEWLARGFRRLLAPPIVIVLPPPPHAAVVNRPPAAVNPVAPEDPAVPAPPASGALDENVDVIWEDDEWIDTLADEYERLREELVALSPGNPLDVPPSLVADLPNRDPPQNAPGDVGARIRRRIPPERMLRLMAYVLAQSRAQAPIPTPRPSLLSRFRRWVVTVLVPAAHFAAIVVLFPYLTGVALNLAVLHPTNTGPFTQPSLSFISTWLTGAATTQLWVRMSFAMPALLLAPDWEGVFAAPDLIPAAAAAFTPPLFGLLAFLAAPHFLCKGILSGWAPATTVAVVHHYSYLVLAVTCLLLRASWLAVKAIPALMAALASQALDHLYLKGVRILSEPVDVPRASPPPPTG